MSQDALQENAIEELQRLGLREYEAKCFVALTKLPAGTAREVSEQIDVPRTRVYEAARALESKGLVEIQHATPQQFRAISVSEAVQRLDRQRRERIDSLEHALGRLEQRSDDQSVDKPEVWALTDTATIKTRVEQLIDDADEEALVLLGGQQQLWDGLTDQVTAAVERDLNVVVGAAREGLRQRLAASLPERAVHPAELNWLDSGEPPTGSVGKVVLVDGAALLASTVIRADDGTREHAVYSAGAHNGLVLVVNRLLGQELDRSPAEDG